MEGLPASPVLREQECRPLSKIWPAFQTGAQLPIKESERSTPLWRELAALALLIFMAAGIRAWLLTHTEVAARDSVGFIRYALELERYPWKEALERNLQHPGYPLVLLAVSWPMRLLLGGTNCLSMQLSAQLASALAGVLLVIPMYYLGRDVMGRRIGFWGTALFQSLPVCARVLSDALSEATFLLFLTTALMFAVRGLRCRSAAPFAWCGLFSGLAYLTRPEGAVIVLATGLVLLGMQFVAGWRRSWPQAFGCAAALFGTAMVVASPYVLVTGRLTNKPTPRRLWETAGWEEDLTAIPQHEARSADAAALRSAPRASIQAGSLDRSLTSAPSHGPLSACLLAIYAPEKLADRRFWGLYAIVTEATKDLQYLSGIPLLLGLWWFRGRFRTVGGSWLVLALCSLHALILWRVAVVVGYVSDRHVLVLILCGVFLAAGGVLILGESLTWIIYRLAHCGSGRFRLETNAASVEGGNHTALTMESGLAAKGHKVGVILLLALIAFGLQEGLKPLHANRAGHRQAGLWLAEHTSPADPVLDPFCWAHYYAGRVFWEGLTPPAPPGYLPTQYVVLEKSPTSEHSRLPMIHEAKALAARGSVVYHWPVDKPEAQAKILVYAVRP